MVTKFFAPFYLQQMAGNAFGSRMEKNPIRPMRNPWKSKHIPNPRYGVVNDG